MFDVPPHVGYFKTLTLMPRAVHHILYNLFSLYKSKAGDQIIHLIKMTLKAVVGNDKGARFRVVIVGGSIAGLVLAHCLHHAGIDYLVLEARDRVDPQVGASIGIFSNGARILDQLGVYKSIEQLTESPVWYNMLTGEGTLVQKVDSLRLIEARCVVFSIPTFSSNYH